jgi:membrane protease YdiL (CAAX protease family)
MSLLCFGIPAAVGVVGIYVVLPAFDQAGFPLLWNYVISFAGMFPLLLGAALVAYTLEGNPMSWAGLVARFRVRPIRGREWLWTAGLVVVYVGGQVLLMPTAKWLASSLPFPLPAVSLPAIDPRVEQTAIPADLFGIPLLGNWGMVALFLTILCLNIFGEELWWRGYILPRQELVHGKWTWLLHGGLWTLFHVPFWWNLIALLPSTLSLAFVTSRLRNTTPGIIAHFTLNGLGLVVILLGVLGVGT